MRDTDFLFRYKCNLSQHHQVTAVDIAPEKAEMINNRKSPIQDDYI